jgi:hypothetical protein
LPCGFLQEPVLTDLFGKKILPGQAAGQEAFAVK